MPSTSKGHLMHQEREPIATTDRNARTWLELLRRRGTRTVDRPHQIYCNRDINFGQIDAVGFDMDYTLATYHQEAVDRLSVELTVERLITQRGYPEELREIEPRPAFAIRGLVLDTDRGNILKMDSHRHVGMAYHGWRELDHGELLAYRQEAIRFGGERYALVDTLYALPEAFLYAALVDFLETERPDQEHDWRQVYEDIRFSIDPGAPGRLVQGRDHGRYVRVHRPRRRPGADAAPAALGGQAAVLAHQQLPALHRSPDDVFARRGAARV